MSLEIVRLVGIAGIYSVPSVGKRRFGVPPGGPFDRESAALANAIVGNMPGTPVVELSNAAIELRALTPTVIAMAGARPNGSSFEPGRWMVESGSIVSISAPTDGARTYLATPGGWTLGPIGQGSILETQDAERNPIRLAYGPMSLQRLVLRCIAGPQANLFDRGWLESGWTVSPTSDRVGVRLGGPPIAGSAELPSEPACPGAVQATNDGQLIILGPDGPTIGGYPKIAVVCAADLDKVGQLRPGDRITFSEIGIDAARDAIEERRSALDRVLRQIAIAAN